MAAGFTSIVVFYVIGGGRDDGSAGGERLLQYFMWQSKV